MSFPSFLNQLFPQQEHLIPDNLVTGDQWVTINSTLFNTQWIDCAYPISGGYGKGPRYLYYFLVFISLVERRQRWVVGVALASVMTISGAAAIHAMVLAAIRTQMAPQYMLDNYESVMVGNNTQGQLWLPVLPMVWDSDTDAVLAIVGVAFLVVTPMQTWSKTFQKAEGKAVLFLWGLLLLAGNDTLPLTNSATALVGGVWDRIDQFHWNETIATEFSKPNNSLPDNCIYPCFDTSWPLRDRTEIIASMDPSAWNGPTYFWLMFAVYFIVSSSGLSTLTIFVVKTNAQTWGTQGNSFQGAKNNHLWKNTMGRGYNLKNIGKALSAAWRIQTESFKDGFNDVKTQWRNSLRSPYRLTNIGKAVWVTWLLVVDIYAKILSLISLVLFIVFIEWTISMDNPGESFRHVGQWGTLVAAILVSISALVSVSWPKVKSLMRAWGIASLMVYTTLTG